MSLNNSQIEAVRHHQGPAIILAGPGSGKTTVITHRITYLINECGVSPSQILVITFTRAAAMEMQSRFLAQSEGGGKGITFGTFHSVFFRILKYAYHYEASNILKEEEQLQLLTETIREEGLELPDEREFIYSILSEISSVKNSGLSLNHYYAKNCSEEVFRRLYERYESKLRRLRKVDFDDILIMTLELLRERGDILGVWQNKYQYILVDEFQDINIVQYEVLRLLAAPQDNLFIVGDDDQSVYRFRGAKPEIMLGFERDYPLAKRILLDVNYRSDELIIRAAGRLIGHNKQRFDKEIKAAHPPLIPVHITGCRDLSAEGEQIVRLIREYKEKGVPYEHMAVLFRTNTGARPVMEALLQVNIPFQMKDQIPNLFEHFIARNILAYLDIADGNLSRGLMLQIMNRPNRYIHREALALPEVTLESLRAYYQDKDFMLDRLDRLEYDLMIMGKMNPFAAIHYLRNAMGYEGYLKEYAEYRRMKPEELYEVLNALQESAKPYQSVAEWKEHIASYTKKLKEQRNDKDQNGVSLCTLHRAKGLEYQVVMIPDVNEENIPHGKAVLDADIEEERRLFYVGMTRAKEALHLYFVKELYKKPREASRFIEELGTAHKPALSP